MDFPSFMFLLSREYLQNRTRLRREGKKTSTREGETSVTLKWIAQQQQMGAWTYVGNRLHPVNLKSNNQSELNLC
jgi:hypothetical protein